MRLLFLLAGLLVSLALAEAALRFFPRFAPQPTSYVGEVPDRASEHLVADPGLGWRMRPNTDWQADTSEYRVRYRSNAEGFRDERPADSSPKPHRIALVGDSLAFGFGVSFPQTYGALLEARLAQTAVLNFALPAFGLDQIWRSVAEVALPTRPDLVIVGFIADDFTRSLTAFRKDVGFNKPTFALENGVLVRQTAEHQPPAWIRFLEANSRLWTGGREALRLLGVRFGVGPWWDRNRAILDAIRSDCRAAGTPVLFVYLPMANPYRFQALADYMQETGADFLDLGSRAERPPGELHYPVDGHPNPEGHRFVAEALFDWIAREMPQLAPPAQPPQARRKSSMRLRASRDSWVGKASKAWMAPGQTASSALPPAAIQRAWRKSESSSSGSSVPTVKSAGGRPARSA
jgi:lysophospholipase L1-like esterase